MTALNVPGTSGNYASTPDHASLDITGAIDIRACIAPDDWTPSADQCILAKSNTTGNQRSYQLVLLSTGRLRFTYSTNGTNATNNDSTVATGFVDGDPHWVRVTWDALGNIRFYTAPDGATWTQLGSTLPIITPTIFSSTAPLEVGSRSVGTADLFNGLIYSVEVRNGVNGTVVASPRFDQQSAGTTSFADSNSKTWTVNGTAAIVVSVDFIADVQDVYPPRVLLSVLGLAPGDAVELYRVVGGERTLVRAGSDGAVLDPSFIRVDAELPFGIPVSYVAVVNEADEFTVGATTYALPGGKVALSDAIHGNAAEAVILAWPENSYDPQSSVFKVGGRNVVVSGDFGMFTGDVEFYVETTSASDLLRALFRTATEGIVQVRQAGGYDGVDSYVAVLNATERRFSQDGSDQRRIWAVSVAEVESWAPALEAAGFTLQDIADVYDGLTLNDLAGDYATLLALAQGDFSA